MKIIKLLTLVTLLISITSCSKEEVIPNNDSEEEIFDAGNFPMNLKEEGTLITGEITNFRATSLKRFVKFNFKTGELVREGDQWDIAMSITAICVNGGEEVNDDLIEIVDIDNRPQPTRTGEGAIYCATIEGAEGIVDNGEVPEYILDEVTSVDVTKLKKDTEEGYGLPTGSGNGWYDYNIIGKPAHTVHPRPGTVLVIKTHDGHHYVKMQITSYYKDNKYPIKTDLTSGYYNFKYTYQKIEDKLEF